VEHRAFQFLSLLAVILSAVWFFVSPGFEPVIAAISGLAALILAIGASSSSKAKLRSGHPAPGARDDRSIAVLPFANLSSDSGGEFFADGMTEEIISAVSNMADFRVIARTSAFAFKGFNEDVREIGRRLGVATVLEGSVRRSGDRLRITVQLVDVAGGHHVWSEQYYRRLADVFEIQDEIAQIIARRLGPEGLVRERREGPTDDLEAYESYLRGMFFYWQYSSEGASRALACFEAALKRDPQYALAHAGASLAHTWLAGFGHEATESTADRARASARKALELEPNLPEGLMSLAEALHYLDWDFEGARQLVRQAIQLSPSSVFARTLHSFCLRAQRRFDEAVRELETAIELDPLAVATHNELGNAYVAAGRREEAGLQIARTLRLNSEFAPTLETSGWLHVQAGRFDEALSVFESLPRGRVSTMAALGFTLASLGRSDEARGMLATLRDAARSRNIVAHVDVARVHAALGEFDEAAEHLERAVERKAIPAILLGSSVRGWGEFRHDPRFEQLVHRVEHSGGQIDDRS
jgi:TolB-like protein/Tfp pilus assembly protein PilF